MKLSKKQKLPYNSQIKQNATQLRKSGNLSEVLLWQRLKGKQLLGLNFNRQKVIGNFIVDFYCPSKKVAIEIDGSSHLQKADYDKMRDEYFCSLGIKTTHLTDYDIKNNLDAVIQMLEIQLKQC